MDSLEYRHGKKARKCGIVSQHILNLPIRAVEELMQFGLGWREERQKRALRTIQYLLNDETLTDRVRQALRQEFLRLERQAETEIFGQIYGTTKD